MTRRVDRILKRTCLVSTAVLLRAGAAHAADAGTAAAPPSAAPSPAVLTAVSRCAAIAAPSDRLACYDALAGRPTVPPRDEPAPRPTDTTDSSPTTLLAPKDGPRADTPILPTTATSLLSTYWELTPADRRGTFEIVGYQPNFFLPAHLTNRINRAPATPTEAVVNRPGYKRAEAKFQLSLRTKLAQDLPQIGGDLWAAFTQQSFWQVYDGSGSDSRPFRNTDYQPEALWVRPIPESLGAALPFGWRWRYASLAIAHESNGQSDPLSRSWNRGWLGLGADRGEWAVTARLNRRLFAQSDTDNNPDLARRRGHAEFQLLWAHERQTALVEVRSSLKNTHDGAIRFEYTYPIFPSQPNGLRWIVQLFSGYGETLTDYNFRQTTLGAGVSFLQF